MPQRLKEAVLNLKQVGAEENTFRVRPIKNNQQWKMTIPAEFADAMELEKGELIAEFKLVTHEGSDRRELFAQFIEQKDENDR